MRPIQRFFLQAALALLLISLVICLVTVLVSMFTDVPGVLLKLVMLGFVTGLYMFLGWVSARLMDKDVHRTLGTVGLVVTLVSYVIAVYFMLGGGDAPSGIFGYMSWLRDTGMVILLITLFPFSAAQGSALLLIPAQNDRVDMARRITLWSIAAVCALAIISYVLSDHLDGVPGKILGYILAASYIISFFGTIITLVLHRLSKEAYHGSITGSGPDLAPSFHDTPDTA